MFAHDIAAAELGKPDRTLFLGPVMAVAPTARGLCFKGSRRRAFGRAASPSISGSAPMARRPCGDERASTISMSKKSIIQRGSYFTPFQLHQAG